MLNFKLLRGGTRTVLTPNKLIPWRGVEKSLTCRSITTKSRLVYAEKDLRQSRWQCPRLVWQITPFCLLVNSTERTIPSQLREITKLIQIWKNTIVLMMTKFSTLQLQYHSLKHFKAQRIDTISAYSTKGLKLSSNYSVENPVIKPYMHFLYCIS